MHPILPNKLHGLDHLRALAIGYVFLFHYFILSDGQPAWLPDFASFGWTGVDLFFVLSGFLISSQLFAMIAKGAPISLRTFFIKRFFRIVPAYVVTVALYFLFPVFREKEQLPPLWKFVTFTQNIGLDLQYFGTFSHAWSLCVEEHFYLLLPLLLTGLQRSNSVKYGYWWLAGIFTAGLLLRFYSFNSFYVPHIEANNSWRYWYQFVYYPTYNRLDGLLMGVALAALVQFYPQVWLRVSRFGNWFLVFALLVLGAAWQLCRNQQTFGASVWGFPLVAFGYGFLVAGALSSKTLLYRKSSVVTAFIAQLSFGIYLTHKGIIHLTHEFLGSFQWNAHLMLLVCILNCILAAWLLYVLVERPFLRLRHRVLGEQRTF